MEKVARRHAQDVPFTVGHTANVEKVPLLRRNQVTMKKNPNISSRCGDGFLQWGQGSWSGLMEDRILEEKLLQAAGKGSPSSRNWITLWVGFHSQFVKPPFLQVYVMFRSFTVVGQMNTIYLHFSSVKILINSYIYGHL